MGWGNGGHGHADLLSVQLTGEGRERLIDPGTGSYMRREDRDWFRGTAAHNTLEVDGRSQAIPAGPSSGGECRQCVSSRGAQDLISTTFAARTMAMRR